MQVTKFKKCKCGCGKSVKRVDNIFYSREHECKWRTGRDRNGNLIKLPKCMCGCGSIVKLNGRKFYSNKCVANWLKLRKRVNHSWQNLKKKKHICKYNKCNNMTYNKYFCSWKCYWNWRIGRFVKDAHPQWQGGISNRPYDFEFNGALKELIKKKYNNVCQICFNKTNKGHCHHIHYIKTDSRPETLILLDKNCHMMTNFNRDYWFAYFCYLNNIEPEEVLKGIKENACNKI